MTATYGHRGAGQRRRRRPLGSLCVWCHHRPALPDRRHRHLATLWCSDAHRQAEMRARKNARRVELANELRRALNLPDGRSADFTAPELAEALRRVRMIRAARPGYARPSRHDGIPAAPPLQEVACG